MTSTAETTSSSIIESVADSGTRSSTGTRSAELPLDERLSLAVAGRFIDGLAARDFDAVIDTLATDVTFRALLPHRMLDLSGHDAVRTTMDLWFGGADEWDLVEAVVGEVGGRIHLRWRLRLTNAQIGPGHFLVEQQVYADADAEGHLCDVALLCTGYRSEAS